MNFAFLILLSFGFLSCASGKPSEVSTQPLSSTRGATYYYLLSEVELRRNNPWKAQSYLKQALSQDEKSAYLWYKYAFFAAALGDLPDAEEHARKSLEIDPQDQAAWVLLGKIYQSQEKKVEAIAAYRRSLDLDPSSEEAYILLLESHVANQDYTGALKEIDRWKKRDPGNIDPLFYEAWIYQNFLKNTTKATATYNRILIIEPDNRKALAALLEIYMEAGNQKKVAALVRKMEDLDPTDLSVKLKVALLYYEQKQFDRAVEKFLELLKLYPQEERLIYYLGVIYENLKKDAFAEVEFAKIQASSHFFRDARLHLAYLKRRQEKEEEAVKLLENSIVSKPQEGAFYEYLSEIYRDRKDYPKAISILKDGLAKSSEKETLHYALGLTYDRAGRFEDCIRSMKAVLKINPDNASALNYIGYSYADRDLHLDEALNLLQKAVLLRPGDGFIIDSLGWVYFKKGDLENAETQLKKAYQLIPQEPVIVEHLGDLEDRKKDAQAARKYYEESLAILEKKKENEGNQEEVFKDIERVKGKIKKVQGL